MPTQTAPWTKVMLHRLDDGDWHTLSDLLAVALPTIPQQRSRRVADTERARGRTGPGSTARQGDAVLRGARDIARKSLFGLVRRGHLELVDGRYRKTSVA